MKKGLMLFAVITLASLSTPVMAEYEYEFEQYKEYATHAFRTFDEKLRGSLNDMDTAIRATKYSGPSMIDIESLYLYEKAGGNGRWVGQAEIYATKSESIRRLLEWYYSGLDKYVAHYAEYFEQRIPVFVEKEYVRFKEDREIIMRRIASADRELERQFETERAEGRLKDMSKKVDLAMRNMSFIGVDLPSSLSGIKRELEALEREASSEALLPGAAPEFGR